MATPITPQKVTMINPTTGKTEIIEGGSRRASELFGQGYYLMGSGGEAVGYNPPPTTPMAAQQNMNLPTAARTPAQLFGGVEQPAPVTPPPDTSGYKEFNSSLMDMLKTYQQLNPASLQIRKNALLKAQYNRVSEITPEELQTLSPTEQAAIRGSNAGALTPEIESVQNMLTQYQGQIQNFGNVLTMAQNIGSAMQQQEVQDYQLKADAEDRNYQRQRDFQTGLQNQVFQMFQTFGPTALEGIDDNGLAEIEQLAGMPLGIIRTGMDALQRAEKKAKNEKELEVLRQLAFSPEVLQAGVAPELFLKEFPELKPVWEQMSNVARGQLDQASRLNEAQIAAANRSGRGAGPSTGITQIDGRNVLINMDTGDTIRDLGAADEDTSAFYDAVNSQNQEIAAGRQTNSGARSIIKSEFGAPDDILDELLIPDQQQSSIISALTPLKNEGWSKDDIEKYVKGEYGFVPDVVKSWLKE